MESTHTQTAQVKAIYQDPHYEEIVKPHRRFLIPNYFIQHWVKRLGPTLAWIVVSLQQACWRANDDICTISQASIGSEIGLTDRAIRKVFKNNQWLKWYIPKMVYQKGIVNKKSGTYQPLPKVYSVYANPPLIPEHLKGLYVYFQQTCPSLTEAEHILDNLLNMKAIEVLKQLETLAPQSKIDFTTPHTLGDIFALAAPFNIPSTQKTLNRKLAQLQYHLSNIGDTVCRQYFRLNWVARLGPALAWLVIALRSRCYYNKNTGELRDTYIWRKKELMTTIGQSSSNLRYLRSHPDAPLFFRVLEDKHHSLTIQVTMNRDPLTTETIADFWDTPSDTKTNLQKVPVTPDINLQKVPVTPSLNSQKVPVTLAKPAKSSGHSPSNLQKVPLYKYFKNQRPNVVVKDIKEIKKLLLTSGLSGAGLETLCNKKPSLDLKNVKAVVLYAEANELGPGYIYQHLYHNYPSDSTFLRFASVDNSTLATFLKSVDAIKDQGQLTAQTVATIADKDITLFAQFVAAFTKGNAEDIEHYIYQQKRNDIKDTVFTSPLIPNALDTLWASVLAQLQQELTKVTFDTWIKETQLISRDGVRFTIKVKNNYAKEWLQNRLKAVIKRTLLIFVEDINQTEFDIEVNFVV